MSLYSLSLAVGRQPTPKARQPAGFVVLGAVQIWGYQEKRVAGFSVISQR